MLGLVEAITWRARSRRAASTIPNHFVGRGFSQSHQYGLSQLDGHGYRGDGATIRCAHVRTAFGTIILHVSPEAGIGAPLAAVALHWRR